MVKIPVDAATAEAMRAAADTGAELVGPDGKTVGGVVKLDLYRKVQRILARRRRLLEQEIRAISTAELNAIVAAGGGVPHEEVVKRLGLE